MKSGLHMKSINLKMALTVNFLFSLFIMSTSVDAHEVFYLNPGSNQIYSSVLKESVLRLALEKTLDDYGPYEIKYTEQMTSSRAKKELKAGRPRNLVLLTNYSDKNIDEDIVYVPLPVDLGLTGKRICFTTPNKLKQSRDITNLEDLQRFSFAQGLGAEDANIFRQNNVKVDELANEDDIFELLKRERKDFFCRGINEVGIEYINTINNFGIPLNDSFLLVYDLPRLFFMNKRDWKAFIRLQEGVFRAHADGSLLKLNMRFLTQSGIQLNLKKRNCIELENSNTSQIGFDYKKYFTKAPFTCNRKSN